MEEKKEKKGKKDKDQDDAPVVDTFFNKEINFSISWYSSLQEYHNQYMMDRIKIMDELTDKGKKTDIEHEQKMRAIELMKNPCFLIAHELYDALPIYQF